MSVDLSQLIGHENVGELLDRSVRAGRVPHAMLFAGPDGIGKRTAALALARALVAGDDPEEQARFDRGAHDRFVLYEDLTRPMCVRRSALAAVAGGDDALLAEYGILEAEGWITGVSTAPGGDAVDRLVRNEEKFTGRKGIPFADVLEKELNALEKSRKSSPVTVQVARRLFSGGTSRAYYKRNLGIELINGKGDGAYFRTIESLLARSAGGAWRVAILDDAHRMTDAAENAFLKTLEEPPPDTLLILVTSDPMSLLPTTVSRCARVPFDALSAARVAGFLRDRQGLGASDAELLASLSGGSIGKALELSELDFGARREFVQALLPAIARADLLGCLERIGGHLGEARASAGDGVREAERRHALLLLELLVLSFRDLALTAAGAGAPLLSGVPDERIGELAAQRAAADWERLFSRAELAATDIERNVEPRLALEGLFVDALPAGAAA